MWVEEAVALCRERHAFLFDLTVNERAFLDGVLDRGEIDAGLLDIAPEIRVRNASRSSNSRLRSASRLL